MILLRDKFYSEGINSVDDIVQALRSTARVTELYKSLDWLRNEKPELLENCCWNLTGSSEVNCPIDLSDCKLYKGQVIAIKNMNDQIQYFGIVNLGKNGPGDFVEDDLKEFERICELLKTKYKATWIDMPEATRDICDDVSSWVITFKL